VGFVSVEPFQAQGKATLACREEGRRQSKMGLVSVRCCCVDDCRGHGPPAYMFSDRKGQPQPPTPAAPKVTAAVTPHGRKNLQPRGRFPLRHGLWWRDVVVVKGNVR